MASGFRAALAAPAVGFLIAAACSSANTGSKFEETGGTGSGGTSGSGSGATGNGGSSTGGASGALGVGGSSTGGAGGSIVTDAAGGSGGSNIDGPCEVQAQTAQQAPVDIIWMIDTSCSMEEEINQVQNNINGSFTQIISANPAQIDWKVIVLGARSPQANPASSFFVCIAPPLAGNNCGDNLPRFKQLDCNVGSTDSLAIASRSFSGQGTACPGGQRWDNQLRPGSKKVFVVVTDDNATVVPLLGGMVAQQFDTFLLGGAVNGFPPPPAQGVFGFPPATRNYVFHAITGTAPNGASGFCTDAVNDGAQYKQLAGLTGGLVRSICESDWSSIFTSIANEVVTSVSCRYAVDPNAIDPSKVNVTWTRTDGTQVSINKDPNRPCTDPTNQGWQWDNDQHPTQLILCNGACSALENDVGSRVDLQVGCPTKEDPPPA